jgi:RimJ/RimL family protein N-acetyltransferase
VLEQGRREPSELVAGEIVWEVVEGVLGVDRVPVDDPPSGHLSHQPYLVRIPELRFPSLADDVVRLRPWREADVPAQLLAFSDPLFERFSDWAPRTTADACAYLAGHEQARHRGEQVEFALVEPHDDDVVLGGGSLNNINLEQGRARIGYWLVPQARGRGIATHAVRLMSRWAFEDLQIGRLELTCGPDSRASQKVAERCGFTREGVLRAHMPFKGTRRDTVLFSLLPGELR